MMICSYTRRLNLSLLFRINHHELKKQMLKQMISRSFSVKVIVCLLVGWSASGIAKPPQQGGLTGADCDAIIAAARADASGQDADFRAGDAPPKYHYACVDRTGKIVSFASDEDAWEGSRDVAKAKAFTAMAFSSDQNALTTRTIFCATQPGGPPLGTRQCQSGRYP